MQLFPMAEVKEVLAAIFVVTVSKFIKVTTTAGRDATGIAAQDAESNKKVNEKLTLITYTTKTSSSWHSLYTILSKKREDL